MTRRLLLAAAALAALAVLAVASVASVPEATGAWCSGRFLGPGLSLKPPFARVLAFPPGDQQLRVERDLRDREGGSQHFVADLTYRWDLGRLAAGPQRPDRLADELEVALASVDGSLAATELGPTAEQRLRERLGSLPLEVVRLQPSYPSPALEELRAAARPTHLKVVIVAFDGLDWGLLDRLIAEGRCPTFARFKREGAWGEIVSRPPVLSPLIWTTIATGRLPEEHGIVDFVVSDPRSGQDIPITNQWRKVQAFWNILTDLGLRVNLVNWWATYPAEPVNGVMVSERVFYQLFGISPSLDDPANVHPPELAAEILPLLVEADDITYDEVRHYVEISKPEYEAALAEARVAENPFDNRVNHLRKILAVTHGVFKIGHWLLEQHPADLTALYIEGTDTIGHRYAHFLPPRLPWVNAEEFRRNREAMPRYYELCDRELAELMTHTGPDTLWLVVTDHGFFTGAARPSAPPDDFTTGAPQWHRMVGVFLAAGAHVRPGKLARVHIDDICRTVLWLQGAPVAADLEGRELVELMDPAWVSAHPKAEVATYDHLPHDWIRETAPSTVDAARLQELQALGYVEGPAPAPGEPVVAEPAPPAEAKVTEPYNLAKIAERRGNLQEAERQYLRAIEIDPKFGLGMAALADVYRRQGERQDSLRWTLRALETGSSFLPPSILVDFVDDAQAAGRVERVLPALEMLRRRWGDTPAFATARGVALRALGRPAEAVKELEAAVTKSAEPRALEELLALAAEGQPVDAERLLEQQLAAAAGDIKKLNGLAVLCLQQGRPALAERALRRVYESDPTNPGVIGNLATALQSQGKSGEAARLLADAVRSRPNDGNLRFNYAAVLAALGRDAEALEQLETLERFGAKGARLVAAKAKVLVRLGRIDEARGVLGAGARAHPDNAEIRELLAALEGGG